MAVLECRLVMRRAPRPCYPARMSPDQCRDARAILKWTRRELADAAGVTLWVDEGNPLAVDWVSGKGKRVRLPD